MIIIQRITGTILGGKCECKAGLGGYCKHVAAIIFQILDSQRQGKQFLPRDMSKTSKPQAWGKPRVEGTTCVLFRDLDFTAFDYERDMHAKVRKPKKDYASFQACPMGNNCVQREKIETFQQSLRALGRAHQLVKTLGDNDCKPVHISNDRNQSNIPHNGTTSPEVSQTSNSAKQASSHNTLSFNVSDKNYEFYTKSVCVDASQAKDISDKTKGQRSNPAWLAERKLRLTASNFKSICNMKAKTDPEKRLKNMSSTTVISRKRKSK